MIFVAFGASTLCMHEALVEIFQSSLCFIRNGACNMIQNFIPCVFCLHFVHHVSLYSAGRVHITDIKSTFSCGTYCFRSQDPRRSCMRTMSMLFTLLYCSVVMLTTSGQKHVKEVFKWVNRSCRLLFIGKSLAKSIECCKIVSWRFCCKHWSDSRFRVQFWNTRGSEAGTRKTDARPGKI